MKLERVESDLVAAQKAAVKGAEVLKLAEGKKETVHAEANKLREEGIIVEAKLKEAEQENAQLNKKMEKLRAGFVAQKRKMKEVRVGFATLEEGVGDGVAKTSG